MTKNVAKPKHWNPKSDAYNPILPVLTTTLNAENDYLPNASRARLKRHD